MMVIATNERKKYSILEIIKVRFDKASIYDGSIKVNDDSRFIPYRNEMSNSCLLRRILVDHSSQYTFFFPHSRREEKKRKKGKRKKAR